MTASPRLFSPIDLGPIALPNRIMISPMCQYSAEDGNATDWHLAHLGSLAMSGAGLLCVEATAVNPEGRITPGDLGLYSDANEQALARALRTVRAASGIPLAIQLSHAGRKASSHAPWDGGALIPPEQGGWLPVAPSALPHKSEEAPPREMNTEDIARVSEDFAQAARRAMRLGFQVIEVHMAHGYLLHQFLSPLSNRRNDAYGGSLENRMRLPLQVFAAVSEAVKSSGGKAAVGVRISASDWVEGGWDISQSIELCRALQAMGCDFVDVSSGGVSPQQKIAIGPGYQVGFAQEIKRAVSMPVISVGMITEPDQAESIIAQGKADMVALARGMLNDPRWPWRAAAGLGGTVLAPKQYWRSLPHGSPAVFGNVKIGQR